MKPQSYSTGLVVAIDGLTPHGVTFDPDALRKAVDKHNAKGGGPRLVWTEHGVVAEVECQFTMQFCGRSVSSRSTDD